MSSSLRVLIAHPGPGYSVADVWAGWDEALDELGIQTFDFNLDARLAFYDSAYLLMDPTVEQDKGMFRKALTNTQAVHVAMNGLAAALFKIRPHVLLVVSGFFTDMDVFDQARALGTKVVLLATEEPYELSRHMVLAPHVDLMLVNDPTNLDTLRQVVRVEYMPHAYRPSVHHPGPATAELVCDLGFVGTGYPSRVRFLEAMDLDGLVVKLGGNWQSVNTDRSPLLPYLLDPPGDCMDNTDAVGLYRSARVGLNLYRREAETPDLQVGWAMGPREVEQAACGLFYLRDPRPESDEVLRMLPTFSGPEEASKQLRWYLDHPEERAEAAHRARAAVADRTFTRNAKRLLKLLDI